MNFLLLWVGAAFVGIALTLFFLYTQSFFRRDRSFAQRLIPYEPGKPVPWNALELSFFFAVWVLIISASIGLCRNLQFSSQIKENVLEPERMLQLQKEHEITQLIVCGQDDPRVFLVVLLAGVMIVPLGEEFLFRLLLQGYLEKQENHLRKRLKWTLPCLAVRGVFPILCSATVFAAVHWRSTTAERPVQHLFDNLLGLLVGYLVVLAVITAYLLLVCGLTLQELGIDRRKIFSDCLLGFGAAVFLLPPVYFLNYGLTVLIGDVGFALDPIPLFFFAVGLGVLYFRTRRILPAVILHGIFNGVAAVSVYMNAYTYFLNT
ncbi:MAG: CPBP family glutamic-type intramembrane protease [Planctomycetaceae bacterium]|nr:CPBP family glutamic-type intramembrane protease [Planctomycetaceae bacterium]